MDFVAAKNVIVNYMFFFIIFFGLSACDIFCNSCIVRQPKKYLIVIFYFNKNIYLKKSIVLLH